MTKQLENEDQVQTWMERSYATGGMSGQYPGWQDKKAEGLRWLDKQWELQDRRMEAFEAGMGDATLQSRWPGFMFGRVRYTGVDIVADIVTAMGVRYPTNTYQVCRFSQVPEEFADAAFDLVLLMDVLYHIPDPGVEARLLDWAFTHSTRWVYLTHSTDLTKQAPPVYFPRKFVVPEGWREVWSVTSAGTQVLPQRAVILERIR